MTGPAPVTELQARVLVAMLDLETSVPAPHSPSEIAEHAGVRVRQVIAPLTGLSRRGLIEQHDRPDGRVGTAYRLTQEGRTTAEACHRMLSSLLIGSPPAGGDA